MREGKTVWGNGGHHPESVDSLPPPVFGVVPVVGDAKWIWTKPPHGETGYLEPRP